MNTSTDINNRLQLFILPYAGGNSSSFNNLLSFMDEQIEVIQIEYSGRNTRIKEKLITDYNEFIGDVAKQINLKRNNRYEFAILGYSMGSVLTYDILRQNMVKGKPVHAFLCAKGALSHRHASMDYGCLPDEEFAQKIESLGGIDERILNNKRFMDIYLVPIRSDYKVLFNFRFHYGHIPCNVSAIYSPNDPLCYGVEEMESITNGTADLFPMGDSHFFIKDHWRDVANIVNEKLRVKTL